MADKPGKKDGPQSGNKPTDRAAESTPSYAETVGLVPIPDPLEDMDGKLAAALTRQWSEEDRAKERAKAKGGSRAGVDPAVLDRFIGKINEIYVQVQTAEEEIGEVGFTEACGGDPEVGFSKTVFDYPLFDAAYKSPNLTMDRRRFKELVEGSALQKRVKAEFGSSFTLGFSQAVEITRVKDKGSKMDLAVRAITENLSVRQVREIVRKLNSKASGSSLSDTIRKGIADRKKALTDQELQGLIKDKERLATELSEKERRDIRSDLQVHLEETTAHHVMIQDLDNTLFEIEADSRAKTVQKIAGAMA